MLKRTDDRLSFTLFLQVFLQVAKVYRGYECLCWVLGSLGLLYLLQPQCTQCSHRSHLGCTIASIYRAC